SSQQQQQPKNKTGEREEGTEKRRGGVTCIHIIGPTAGLGAAARRWGTARVKDIIHGALHLTVINGLALGGGECEGDHDTEHACSEGHQTLEPELKTRCSDKLDIHLFSITCYRCLVPEENVLFSTDILL
uniref:Uncharacterized protein n=1 Tax=Oryzias latipes TaxID=8090 RepID=A0A3P9HZV0_ORYLA